jgi:hypothetical protein
VHRGKAKEMRNYTESSHPTAAETMGLSSSRRTLREQVVKLARELRAAEVVADGLQAEVDRLTEANQELWRRLYDAGDLARNVGERLPQWLGLEMAFLREERPTDQNGNQGPLHLHFRVQGIGGVLVDVDTSSGVVVFSDPRSSRESIEFRFSLRSDDWPQDGVDGVLWRHLRDFVVLVDHDAESSAETVAQLPSVVEPDVAD